MNRAERRTVKKGFKPKRKIYEIDFPEDHDLYGLEISLRGVSVDTILELMKLKDISTDDPEADDVERILELVGENVVEWNLLDEDDQPVPPGRAGVGGEDLDFFIAVITAWLEAMTTGLSGPKGERSPPGSPAEVQKDEAVA